MVAPDVQIEDGKGTILISSEEGETEGKLWVGGVEKLVVLKSFVITDMIMSCHSTKRKRERDSD